MTASSDKYTAEKITWVHTWVPNKLFSFRTTRYPGFRFVPGQFARLGVRKADPAAKDGSGYKMVWRAYSIVSADYDEFLEFYSIVVPGGEFTSELANLKIGDTVYIEKTNYGFLTTDRFEQGKDLWMLSSGTGLAPFISILYDMKIWEEYEKLILVHSVREADELAYQDVIQGFKTHEFFGQFADRLVYVPTVTRQNVPGALHARITTLLEDGQLEKAAGTSFCLERSRVMICGNPDMVDDIRRIFSKRGFTTSRRGQPGNMAVENYW